MKVENQIDASDLYDHMHQGEFTPGAKRLYVRNAPLWDHVILDIVEYSGDRWKSLGVIEVSARDINNAVSNATNN